MDPQQVMDISREAIWMVIKLGGPIMMIGLFVGVIIALLQALTQVQEMTLAFVPKIIVIFASLFVFLPLGMAMMQEFMMIIADLIIGQGG